MYACKYTLKLTCTCTCIYMYIYVHVYTCTWHVHCRCTCTCEVGSTCECTCECTCIYKPVNNMLVVCMQVDLPQFKTGDLVRISGDLEKVRSLQHGHGDWSDAVLLVREREGGREGWGK